MFFFFFSSRRRHTRFDCDWSSDVCSSDLFVSERRKIPQVQENHAQHDQALTQSCEQTDALTLMLHLLTIDPRPTNAKPLKRLLVSLCGIGNTFSNFRHPAKNLIYLSLVFPQDRAPQQFHISSHATLEKAQSIPNPAG